MAFTDFPNGLKTANDYLTNNISASAQLSTSVANVGRFQVSAEMDFSLKEIICSLLAGRGLKLPNIQICVSLNIKELLANTVGVIQQELYDALASLDQQLDKFMDHLKIDEVLGRVNNVLGEVTSIANMINFCSAPIDPVAIPNVLEDAMESFLGKGKEIIDSIGNIIPEEIGGCLIDGSFNRDIWQGGILGKISDNWDNFIAGAADQAWIDSIVADVAQIENDIVSIIDRERNVTTNYDQGGSELAETPRDTNKGMGALFNSQDEGIRGATDIANKLYNIEQVSGDYKLTATDGTVYCGPLELICDPDLLRILRRPPDPTPNVAEQVPIYNYCNEIIGYQQIVTQEDQQTSVGLEPGTIDQPGYDAGGLPTSPINEAIAQGDAAGGGTVNQSINNSFEINGATLFVSDEEGLLNSNASEGQMVFREDIEVTYLRNDLQTGTLDDYYVVGGGSSGSLGPFLTEVNTGTGSGFLTRNGDLAFYRQINGTANQITVGNGTGISGNPVISMTNNPIIPGSDAMVVPFGATADRVSTTNGALRYNTSLGTFEGYQAGTWVSFATGATGVTNGANIGSGSTEIYKQNNGGVLEFRTIDVSGALSVSTVSDKITLSENLTGSNLGAGAEILTGRSVNDFQFRSLTAGTGVTITQNTNDIEISASGLGGSTFEGTIQTTTATLAEVLFDGVRETPGSNKVWFFTVTAVANRQSSNDATAIKIEGLIDNNAGSVTIIGTAGNKTTYNSTLGTANYDLTLDILSNEFRVRVNGDVGHTVDWTVKYEIIEA